MLSLLIAAALNGLMFVGRFYDHDASHLFSSLLAKLPLRQLLDDLYEAGLGGLERSAELRRVGLAVVHKRTARVHIMTNSPPECRFANQECSLKQHPQ